MKIAAIIAGVLILIIAAFGLGISENSGRSGTNTSSPKRASARAIDLSGQRLTKVPEEILRDNSIESLDLSNNELSGALPAEIRNLTNLRKLDISNNKFTGLPAELGQLRNLEILNAANNRLTGLPRELSNLSNLKTLDISGNNYSAADLTYIRERLPTSTDIKVSR